MDSVSTFTHLVFEEVKTLFLVASLTASSKPNRHASHDIKREQFLSYNNVIKTVECE